MRCNYERYRFLVLNQFKGLAEQDVLTAIDVEEMYLIPGQHSTTASSRDKTKYSVM